MLRSAGLFVVLGAGVVLQLVAQLGIAYYFGASTETDALFVALGLPLLFFGAVQEGLRSSLVPAFSALRAEGKSNNLWVSASNLLNTLGLCLGIFVFVGVFLSPLLICVLAPGLEEESKTRAASLLSLLLLMVPGAGLVGVAIAIHNLQGRFFLSAALNILRGGAILLALAIGGEVWGIEGIAAAYIYAPFLLFFCLIPGLRSAGFCYRIFIDLRDPLLRAWFSLSLLPFFGWLVRQAGPLFERFLASYFPAGGISAVSYSYTVFFGAALLLSTTVLTTNLPLLSAQAAKENLAELRRIVASGLRFTCVIGFLLMLMLMGLSYPLMGFLSRGGALSPGDASLTALLLFCYAPGLIGSCATQVLGAVFYAFQDMRTPFFHLLWMLGLNVILDLLLVLPLGLSGLPVASSLTSAVSLVRISWLVRLRVGSFWREVW